MSDRRKIVLVILVIAALLALETMVGTAAAQKGEAIPPPSKKRGVVASREAAAKSLLLLMDTDTDGRVSKQEWMSFMEAEFDRLDTNHDGFVDVKDMERSQIKPVPFYHAGK